MYKQYLHATVISKNMLNLLCESLFLQLYTKQVKKQKKHASAI